MTCPRCGTEMNDWPCPNCGFPVISRYSKDTISRKINPVMHFMMIHIDKKTLIK